jgi:hypothetical protein
LTVPSWGFIAGIDGAPLVEEEQLGEGDAAIGDAISEDQLLMARTRRGLTRLRPARSSLDRDLHDIAFACPPARAELRRRCTRDRCREQREYW